MVEPTEAIKAKGEKCPSSWTPFIVWPLVILLLYVLSYGPVLMMFQKGNISFENKYVWKLYRPLNWTSKHTPLRKPVEMYLRLWVPTWWFDKNGDMIYP